MNFMKTLVAASVAGAMMVGAVCAQEDSGTAVTVCLAVKATNIGSVANLTNGLMLSDVKRC